MREAALQNNLQSNAGHRRESLSLPRKVEGESHSLSQVM